MLGWGVLLALMLTLVLLGPWWPYSRRWGYRPGALMLGALILWLALIWAGFVALAWPWAAPA